MKRSSDTPPPYAERKHPSESMGSIYCRRSDLKPLFGISEPYAKRLAWLGQGPKFRKLNRICIYKIQDVIDWIESH